MDSDKSAQDSEAKSGEKADDKKKEHMPPPGATRDRVWRAENGDEIAYTATAEWLVLRKKENPAAEMFHTFYRPTAENKERPITFVFNGGPGAASAYLHIGGLGPQRVMFDDHGSTLPPPAKLTMNHESWLEFTDLVFVDPIGTGFSRIIEKDAGADDGKTKKDPSKTVEEKEYYQLNRDLNALGEFIERFLSKHKRWESPIYLAGESYGGFRTAKLAKLLQEKHGVGLTAVIAISPALEWSLLNHSDYDVLHTVDTFCTMALAAAFHGKSKVFGPNESLEAMRNKIEAFAGRDLAQALILGESHPETELNRVFSMAADFLGLPSDLVLRAHGRVTFWRFARELLKESRKVIGFYDATLTAVDPFPDREMHQAPDPTLVGIERVFCGGVNQILRTHLGLETERIYKLLSMEVNSAWKRDDDAHAFDLSVGATDDLRFAMSMNPHMRVFICHGYYDMVTPYFSSLRLIEQMKLLPEQREKIELRCFGGGHMFYTWAQSRKDFRDWVKQLYVS